MKRLFIAALFCLFLSITANADTFVILPSGEVAFNTSFTTQGVFTCSQCTGSGTNSVTFGSGGNTLTLTFSGVSTSLLVSAQSQSVLMGQIQVATTGSGFVFPSTGSTQPLLFFTLQASQTSPAVGGGSIVFNSTSGGQSSLFLHTTTSDYFSTPIGPNPPGANFGAIVFSFTNFTIPNTNTVLDINANVVAVPEPTSLLLLGSGLGMTLRLLKKRRVRD